MELSSIFSSCIDIFRKFYVSLCYRLNSKKIYISYCKQIHSELQKYLNDSPWGNDSHIQEIDLKTIEKIVNDQSLSISDKKRAALMSLIYDLREINQIIVSFLSKRQDFIDYIRNPAHRMKANLSDDLSTGCKNLRHLKEYAHKEEVNFVQRVPGVLLKVEKISDDLN